MAHNRRGIVVANPLVGTSRLVDGVKQRRSFFSILRSFDLSATCTPGAAEAADQTREGVKIPQFRDRIDYE